MAETSFPFATGPGSAIGQSQWSSYMKALFNDGVVLPTDLLPFGDSSGMQVKVPAGSAFVQGFYYNNSATKTIAVTANSSGSPRVDYVALSCDEVGGSTTAIVVAGTPAGSPVPPTLVQTPGVTWQIPLATVAVANGAATIAAANVTDARGFVGPRVPNPGYQSAVPAATINNSAFTSIGLAGKLTVTASGRVKVSAWTAGYCSGTAPVSVNCDVSASGANSGSTSGANLGTLLAGQPSQSWITPSVVSVQGGYSGMVWLIGSLNPGPTTFDVRMVRATGTGTAFGGGIMMVEAY